MVRPLTPIISRDKAVEKAIEIIDRDGLEWFSLPKLARAMNVKTPSLYHHFASRADLAFAVAGAIVRETRLPPRPDDPRRWQDWFVMLAVSFREVVFRHRNAALLLLEHVPRELFLAVYDEAAAVLEEAGVPPAVHLQIVEGLETVVYGAALTDAVRDPATVGFNFPITDPKTFTHLSRAVKANTMPAEQLPEAKVRSFLLGVLQQHAESAM
jgi:TetR/AcrR family tetracycline transcriptional repressor